MRHFELRGGADHPSCTLRSFRRAECFFTLIGYDYMPKLTLTALLTKRILSQSEVHTKINNVTIIVCHTSISDISFAIISTLGFKCRYDQMGAKIKTPKISRPNIDPNKAPCRISETQKCPEIIVTNTNYAIGIRGRYQESSDCYEYPKKSRNQQFQTKISFDHPHHLKSGDLLPPRGLGLFTSCSRFPGKFS